MSKASTKQPAEANAFLARLASTAFSASPTTAPREDISNALGLCLEAERERRALWAQDRSNKALKDAFVGLVDPHGDGTLAADGSSTIFRTRARLAAADSTAERGKYKAIPGGPRADSTPSDASYILALPEVSRREHGSSVLVDKNEFWKNWNVFTEGAFSFFTAKDWEGVLFAGGSVLACLSHVPEQYHGSKRDLRRWFHEESTWQGSDIDIFLYGMDERAAQQKLLRLADALADGIPWDTVCIRTNHTVTIASQYPSRHVQFVLRLYASPAEILQGFDVDASGFGFDGSRIWATPRALASLITQCNTIDMTRRSPSYEQRLAKYAERGFEVYWPELERGRIDATIYERAPWTINGLARLLVLEKFVSNVTRNTYLSERRADRSRPELYEDWSLRREAERLQKPLPGDLKSQERIDRTKWLSNSSTYHSQSAGVHVPYGPKWNAKRIERLLYSTDVLLNARWNKKNEGLIGLHRHPSFFGTMLAVMQDCCQLCPVPTTVEELRVHKQRCSDYVSGDLSFMVVDPSRQLMSGSFQPLTTEDWTEQAYISTIEQLMQCVLENNVAAIKAILDVPDVNLKAKLLLQRDYVGRSPLQLALLERKTEAALALIELGARITARLVDGRTNFMLAAQCGNVEVVKAMLARSAKNKEDAAKARAAAPASGDEEAEGVLVDGEDEDEEDEDGAVLVKHPAVDTEEPSDGLPVDSHLRPDVINLAYVPWDVKVPALHYAVLGGSLDVIKLVLEAGGNVRKLAAGLYPIMLVPVGFSTDEEGVEAVKLLLKAGASCAQFTFYHLGIKMYPTTMLTWFLHARRPRLVAALLDCSKASAAMDLVTTGLETAYDRVFYTPPISLAISSGQLGVTALLLSHGAMTFATQDKCQALLDYPAYPARAKGLNLDNYWADTVQPMETSFMQANKAYVMLLECKQRPPIFAPVSTFVSNSVTRTTPQLIDLLSQGLDFSDIEDLPPTEPELKEALTQATGWRDELVAKIQYVAGTREWELLYLAREPNHWEEGKILEPGMRIEAEAYVEDYEDAINDMMLYEDPPPYQWKQVKPLLDLPFLGPPQDHRRVEWQIEGRCAPLHAQQDRRQVTFETLKYRTYAEEDPKSISPRLHERAKELLDAAERGDDEKIRQLTLPSAGCVVADLLPVALWAEEPWGKEEKLPLNRIRFSTLSIAMSAGKWETVYTIIDICCRQFTPPESPEKSTRYSLYVGGSDNDSDADEDSDAQDHVMIHADSDEEEEVEDAGLDKVQETVKLDGIASDCHVSDLQFSAKLFNSIRTAFPSADADTRKVMRKIFVRLLHEQNNSSHANERGRYFNKLLDIAPELDDPELLAAVVQVEGDGASLYFERAFKDSSALTSAQQEESEASEKRGASAPYVGLLVGGKRHATWAVELHNKPTLQRTGTDQPLISLAAAAHASKCLHMLCTDNFKWVQELIVSRRAYVSESIRLDVQGEDELSLWKQELRWLNAVDLADSEQVALAAGAVLEGTPAGTAIAQALLGGRSKKTRKDADKSAEVDERAIATAALLGELLPSALEGLDLPMGESEASAFMLAPSPAIADCLLAYGASPMSMDKSGANVLHNCPDAVLEHLLQTLPRDTLCELLYERRISMLAATPLHRALGKKKRLEIFLALPDEILANLMRVRGGARGLTALGEAVRSWGDDLELVQIMLDAARRLECLDVLRWEDVLGDLPLEVRERTLLLHHTTHSYRRRRLPPLIKIPADELAFDWRSIVERFRARGTSHRTNAGQMAELSWVVEHCGAEMDTKLLDVCKKIITYLSTRTNGEEPDHEGLQEHRLFAMVRAAIEEAPGTRVRIPPAFVQVAVKRKLDARDKRYASAGIDKIELVDSALPKPEEEEW